MTKRIKIWSNVNAGVLVAALTGHSNYVFSLVALSNGYLASAGADMTIKVWNFTDGSLRKSLVGHSNYVYSLVLLQNGNMASGSLDNIIKIWRV